jgi:hypothetical protein
MNIYFLYCLIVPSFLIICMILFGYILPPGREKLILRELKSWCEYDSFTHNEFVEVTVFLSIIFFNLLISKMTPQYSASTPIITKYFICILYMSTISVGVSVLVMSIHCRSANNRTMPLWVSQILQLYI